MVDRIYPTELQLNRANSSDTEAPFLDLNLCISNGTVSTKMYDKRDDFDFDIVNFPFLDGDVPRRTSYGVYISPLIRFARASSNLIDFNYRNKALAAKLLRQGYRYFKLRASLVADLFLFCYERDFMKSLSRENEADIIEAFNSTSRYLDDLLNIDNIYFDQMVDRIYPTDAVIVVLPGLFSYYFFTVFGASILM